MRRLFAALACGILFLLPLFGWLAAEPTPYRDPEGFFSITPPDGWAVDDSGHMGPGLVAKGPAGSSGLEPLIHLTHEPSGIVTLEVRWQTLLGQLRYDMERVRYLSIEERLDRVPPDCRTAYSFRRGELDFLALSRLVLSDGRFFQVTASAPKEDFEMLRPALEAALESLRIAK